MFSAEDPETLRKAFENQRPNDEYASLYQAAFARAQADQIANLSMTRAATLALKPPSLRGALGIGRVKTPTMGIVCQREAELAAFKPRDYFDLFLKVTDGTETLKLTWAAPAEARIYDENEATALVKPLADWEGPVVVKTERKNKAPPKLLDLPTLQQLAAPWGWTAKKTLDTAQSLYETHKITTYPRAENRYLPESEIGNAEAMLDALLGLPFVTVSYREPRVRKGKSGTFSDAGLAGASHHAIVPNVNTRSEWTIIYPKLAEDEQKLFSAIARRYLAAVGPDWVYDRTVISAQPQDRIFAATGIVEIEPGWREAMNGEEPRQAKDDADTDSRLPAWPDGTAVRVVEAGTDRKTTKPPPRYTEGSLIKAMQEAWRFADDPVQANRLKEAKGIGTPATRDTIIEGLKRQHLLDTVKGKLKASELAMAMWALLSKEAPEVLDPAATAEMELLLDEVLSKKSETGCVVSALVGRAVAFNEKLRTRSESGQGKTIDVEVKASAKTNGGAPSPAAIAYAEKIAKAINGKIPKKTLADRNLLSQWIDQNKTKLPSEPSEKQIAFARSISERKQIAIEPADLQSRAALSTWISTHA